MISDYILERNRDETMIVRCRSYQTRLIQWIGNTSIHNTHPSLNVGQAINACLDHIHSLILYFERRFMKGYLTNCTTQKERRRFVDLILNTVENSDYIQVLYSLPEDNVTITLKEKYKVIKKIIRTLGSF